MLTSIATKWFPLDKEKANYSFWVFGKECFDTQVSKYLENILQGNRDLQHKLLHTLKAIDSNPKMYTHDQKFKLLEKNTFEIKIHQLRIACIWDPKPQNLVAIYAFSKKQTAWSKINLEAMRREKGKYFNSKRIKLK
ncbi:MAG: hypothetical protein OEY59_08995 [Deltaproteobacteria bacterium]|nr:hypothetical protein [Deltaproteobacteria bacterium]